VEFEVFRVEMADDGVALVTMNRPDKLNAMDPRFFRELLAVMDSLDADAGVDVGVLTGAGRAFSAGGDIATFAEFGSMPEFRRHLRLVYDAFHSLERADTPIIAAVNGVAFGGGTEITLASDLAIASERARFAFKEPTVGLMPGYGIIRGPQVIGRRWTRRLAMTGEEIDATRAKEIGLVEEVVPHEDLLRAALALAGAIRANAPLGVRLAKQFINRDQGAPGQAESIEATALLFTTDEHKKRVADFLNRDRDEGGL
jgi:enoyl-CoA hydratase/carnithine racemase